MRTLFFEYLDARDRDGSTFSPWAGDLAQAVQRIIEDAKETMRAEESRIAAGEAVSRTVYEISNNQDFRDDVDDPSTSLFAKVDAMIDELDRSFRA